MVGSRGRADRRTSDLQGFPRSGRRLKSSRHLLPAANTLSDAPWPGRSAPRRRSVARSVSTTPTQRGLVGLDHVDARVYVNLNQDQEDGLIQDHCSRSLWARLRRYQPGHDQPVAGDRCSSSARMGVVRSTALARVAVLGGAVGVMSLLLGCSAVASDYQDGTRPTQLAVSTRAHCPSSANELLARDDYGQMVGAGRIPDSFRPVRAVRCT